MVHASIFWGLTESPQNLVHGQNMIHTCDGDATWWSPSENQKEHTNKMNSHWFHLWQPFHQDHKAVTSATHWMTTWTCHSFNHIWIHVLSVNIKRHSLLDSDTQWHQPQHAQAVFSCTHVRLMWAEWHKQNGGNRTLSTSNHEFNLKHFFRTKQNQTLILFHCGCLKHNASERRMGCACWLVLGLGVAQVQATENPVVLPSNLHCWFEGGEAISFLLSSVSTKNDKQQLFWNNVLFLSTHKLPHSHNCIPKKLFIKEIAQSLISTRQNKSEPML